MLALVPNIKAALKWVRQTERRRKRNLDAKSRLKTLFAKAKNEPAIAKSVESEFDAAATKGIIHKNKAARKKSRLAKALTAQAKKAPAAAPAAKPAKRARSQSTKKKASG